MNISDRIRQVVESKGFSLREFCAISGVKYRTLQNYLGNKPPSADFLISLYNFGVSTDWILTGEGEMFRTSEVNYDAGDPDISHEYTDTPEPARFSLSESAPSYEPSRTERLCGFIKHWMATHTGDEQAWFEIDFKNNYRDYSLWVESGALSKLNKQGGG